MAQDIDDDLEGATGKRAKHGRREKDVSLVQQWQELTQDMRDLYEKKAAAR